MREGIVSHIQRFSLHDGPGVRTTVFLKGCQMRCVWCHNPETLRRQPELEIYPDRCIGCGACLAVCEQGARGIVDGPMTHDPARCVGCGRCAEECFGRAIVLVGRRMSVEAVMTEVLADTEFYERSSGGMTISGGEPLVQPDFTGALLNAARASGIATAVETNLGWPWPTVERILPATDLIMADLKVLNDEVHRRETGMSNERVLANFERLARAGVPVIARTPLIAGINDRPSEVAAMADFLAPLGNITCWELLPYHPLGEGKRSSLGLPTAEKPLHPPTSERLEQLIQAARRLGLPVKVATALGSTSAAEPASGCCCDDKVRKR